MALLPKGQTFRNLSARQRSLRMRRIKINYQEGEAHPFVAIDNASEEVIFRHDKLEELEAVCRKLRWHIVSNSAKWILQAGKRTQENAKSSD
jgi:hypothetical protein